MENTIIKQISNQEEIVWINPYKAPFESVKGVCELTVSDEDIADAHARLLRFAPFIEKAFPETKETNGLIESPMVEIENMKKALEENYNCEVPGKMLLKMDSHLAVAGSVKARGGIYEVLNHAERLALKHNKISINDNYAKFAEPEMKEFLSQFTIQAGSTGNLGMSIGIMSAALGFKVKIHMSADAKQWKKDLLRSKGVEVLEYKDDYSAAVANGRAESDLDPNSYFVDDEQSIILFIGYATAAKRFAEQLDEMGITVDEKHPLIMYMPTGVGSAPGGIFYGVKRIFGDNAHCFFVETTPCPSVLLGIVTQKHENANVHDYGIEGNTEADGLACASPSGIVTRLLTNNISGEFTVKDAKLYDYLRLLNSVENIRIEPSSCSAFIGPCNLLSSEAGKEYCNNAGLSKEILENATQVVWATGGKLIPDDIYTKYLETFM